MIFFTTIWSFWGIAEMYHEGWWGAWYNRLPYLVPIFATLLPTLVVFRWPLVGGGLIILLGTFVAVFFEKTVAVIGLAIALVGATFVVDALLKRRKTLEESQPHIPWWRRHWRYVLAVGLPVLITLGVSATMLPVVLTRVDDGYRGARLIEGNDIELIWAPEGPGWNWKQPWGGYPSWQNLALYGVPPVSLGDKLGYGREDDGDGKIHYATEEDMAQTNLCLYLNTKGTALMAEPQQIWRMPTTDEMVRSLIRHGENAGCAWLGEFRERVECDRIPKKESPLWATDHPAVYYWTADAHSESLGYFVAYNGTVNTSHKTGGNPRHSYRCVKEP
jgi:Flp pilus assembly protein protease CpaA